MKKGMLHNGKIFFRHTKDKCGHERFTQCLVDYEDDRQRGQRKPHVF